MDTQGLATFVESLPQSLRIAVVMSIHTKTFKTHPFFKSLNNRRLLTFIGQNFKQAYYEAGSFIYKQGDEITEFRVCTKGIAAFVNPRYHN